jgi:hypothetical protein
LDEKVILSPNAGDQPVILFFRAGLAQLFRLSKGEAAEDGERST